jgi:hypothetical protein
MNELKYQITQILFLVLLGFGAYWAFTHLDDGVTYSRDEIVTQREDTQRPDEIVNVIENENIVSAGSKAPTDESNQNLPVNVDPIEQEQTESSNAINEELILELERLEESRIIMSSGSSGSRVGTVQEFLSIYFSDRNITIDNDYGPTTTRLVLEFQTTELNGGDGRVGPNTLKAMVQWLESN